MLKILPTLAFDTGIEIENWTHLSKFRAAVSVLNASFNFFSVVSSREINVLLMAKAQTFHKEIWWVGSYFCDENVQTWITLSKEGDDAWLGKHKAPRAIYGGFSKRNYFSLYVRALLFIFNFSQVNVPSTQTGK